MMPVEGPTGRSLREQIAEGAAALGLVVRLARSPEIARIARSSGFDFVYIDCQHGLFDPQTLLVLIQAVQNCGLAPLVRVRGADDPDIALLLDNGAVGIVVPDVESADEARRVVAAARFPPRGRRSLTSTSAHTDYAPVPAASAVRELDELTLVICMIESATGLANVREIVAVDGVDGAYVGTNDLLLSLGRPGDFDSPELETALDDVVAACRDAGKLAGCGGLPDAEHQAAAIARGIQLITLQSDLALVASASARIVTELRTIL